MRRLLTFAVISVVALARTGPVQAAENVPENERHLSELAEAIVRAAVPKTFENRKHWDKRKEVFAGVKVKTDGLKVRISKRKEEVRHGFWRRYTVTLIDPDRTLKVRISDVKALGGGRWTYTVTADVRANVDARFEQWNLGVKLLNGSTDADASLRVRAACTLDVRLEQDDEQGSVVVFAPDVKKVDLSLPNLDVRKFGELRGKAATDLFDGLEDVVEDLLQTQEGAVRKEARKEIAEHADDLRIPLGDVLSSPWAALWLPQ